MVWDRIKKLLGGSVVTPAPAPVKADGPRDIPLQWVEAADNPWRVRLLDVRPITQTMLSTSKDPQCAQNAVSFGRDDGTGFIGIAPRTVRSVDAALRFPIDRMLADGVLYKPSEMEHKWAIFVHGGQLIFVRSWTRTVHVVAEYDRFPDHIVVTRIHGSFLPDIGASDFDHRALDYLLRSHALGTVHPVPLPGGDVGDPHDMAHWCMSMFGRHAHFVATEPFERTVPERPLRSHSLLHIAVARADIAGIDRQLQSGTPIDLLAGDGLAPLHWSLAAKDPSPMLHLLERGSPIDVRSEEGATPLMNAVQSSGADRVQLLLDRGAAPDAEAEGHTPRTLAKLRQRDDILALFGA